MTHPARHRGTKEVLTEIDGALTAYGMVTTAGEDLDAGPDAMRWQPALVICTSALQQGPLCHSQDTDAYRRAGYGFYIGDRTVGAAAGTVLTNNTFGGGRGGAGAGFVLDGIPVSDAGYLGPG